MSLTHDLKRLMARHDLSQKEAYDLMGVLVGGEASVEQIAGCLVALQMKGANGAELAGLASYLRDRAVLITLDCPELVDTCGTGGGKGSFNLSTGAAIVAAAAGAKIAKHGNRSVTSQCGSADVLEFLGVHLTDDLDSLKLQFESTGLVFLFAPHHHGVLKSVAPVRKALGVRTVFNQLGPLANPAQANRQLIGVYDRELVRPMAEALLLLGSERAFVVHGQDGMDEISPSAPTWYAEVSDRSIHEGVVGPSDFAMHPVDESALLPGGGVAENSRILLSALEQTNPEHSKCLIPNAAVALLLSGTVNSLVSGAVAAHEAIESGAAIRLLDQLRGEKKT